MVNVKKKKNKKKKRDHFQSFSQHCKSLTRGEQDFEHAQNLGSDFAELNCVVC